MRRRHTIVDAVLDRFPGTVLVRIGDLVLFPRVGVEHERREEHHLEMRCESAMGTKDANTDLDTDRECVQAISDIRLRPILRGVYHTTL